MTLTIKINVDNAAFEDGFHEEIHKILMQARTKLDQFDTWHKGDNFGLKDTNGNSVGYGKFE